eukprot:TRINITY_DN1355_c0_g1_i4.p1 TRINITY_DN1355_c0_g1~~TRINITY_DN1355_c0_g1_i4.p1  ORF type:complete len:184 (+),score=0.66 TRINITY_DN1355_c0_g1_i4:90-641(+)
MSDQVPGGELYIYHGTFLLRDPLTGQFYTCQLSTNSGNDYDPRTPQEKAAKVPVRAASYKNSVANFNYRGGSIAVTQETPSKKTMEKIMHYGNLACYENGGLTILYDKRYYNFRKLVDSRIQKGDKIRYIIGLISSKFNGAPLFLLGNWHGGKNGKKVEKNFLGLEFRRSLQNWIMLSNAVLM